MGQLSKPAAPVVLLAGGTGGARLARGLLDVVGEELVVIANTGDDIEIYGAYVAPDPDLVLFWLADRIDERGWGLAGDSFVVMDGLRELGREIWFSLGDRDLAIGLERARRLAEGARLTETLLELARALGVRSTVLPMSDAPVRTRVRARERWWDFQEWMIRERAAGPVEDVTFEGAAQAAVPPEAQRAIASARAIVIGPSNPIASIGPILAVPGMQAALGSSPAPCVAVSPLVEGRVLKGPTAAFLEWAGRPLSAAGVAAHYGELIDGIVSDELVDGCPTHRVDVRLQTPAQRRELARETLAFAASLARRSS